MARSKNTSVYNFLFDDQKDLDITNVACKSFTLLFCCSGMIYISPQRKFLLSFVTSHPPPWIRSVKFKIGGLDVGQRYEHTRFVCAEHEVVM